jgi:hypothetical protein
MLSFRRAERCIRACFVFVDTEFDSVVGNA